MAFKGPNRLFFACSRPLFDAGDQDKHLNRSKQTSKHIQTHTGTSVYIIYDIKKLLEMSQHKIKATALNFQDLEGKIFYILLIFDQFSVLLTKLNILTD